MPVEIDAAARAILIEQYKSYVEDLGNIGTRHTATNVFFPTIVSILIGVVALGKKDGATPQLDVALLVFLPIFAIGLCFVWWRTLQYFSSLYAVKFAVLREMERSGLPFPTYARERKGLQEGPGSLMTEDEKKEARPAGRAPLRLIVNEKYVPCILAFPFLVVLIYGIWGWVAG